MTSREEYLLYKLLKDDIIGYMSCIITNTSDIKTNHLNNICKLLSQVITCNDYTKEYIEIKDFIEKFHENYQLTIYKIDNLDLLSKEMFNYIVEHIEDIEGIIYSED